MTEQITKQEIEGLLSEQTKVILGAVDERFQKIDERFQKVDDRFQKIDERFQKVDERFQKAEGISQVMSDRIGALEYRMDEFNKKIDRLTTTLDVFLKRLTDREDELTFLRADIDKIKAVLKEKLGVEILIQGR
ncbi:MAG: hypothetical protein A3J55_04370 [Candidatus Ryanbacteria bacterium RIFCSPHIGHO2_02_FULL_45_17b]|uniref:t-SNARE coiled-coil homology domain-containing protein n=1 Tax=Candidatus Ryanbacteria bacterium RIFCSPHIGHO2_01_FULL_45_22 TaxID=1802114 RepID=A0A1G2G3M3_9BACT|nr:MAG: hypothetical protein A2719_04945 [Candidatus Ryanbacteria bacterium RIFCSPHIGHO2_01_FULL_45_22]OGZ47580.1 MAG: hypothetical protein A3J55_04370 [Candidatus Ryanbacteria bacterium RIFCSPHIGHO2_02_FULL_45_17b]